MAHMYSNTLLGPEHGRDTQSFFNKDNAFLKMLLLQKYVVNYIQIILNSNYAKKNTRLDIL